MLEQHSNADVNASPSEGPHRGKTPLWFAAARLQWDLVALILAGHPEANTQAVAQNNPQMGSVSTILERENAPSVLKKWIVVNEMNRDVEGIQLRARLESPIPEASEMYRTIVRDLNTVFRRVAMANTNFMPQSQSGVKESSILDPLPRDVRGVLVLTMLRNEDPDLEKVYDRALGKLFMRFLSVYKKIDYDDRSIELVAAKVLDTIAPVEQRNPEAITESRVNRIKTVRGWIINEIKDAILQGLLDDFPNRPTRDQLASVLTTKSLSAITREWIRTAIKHWADEALLKEIEASRKRREPPKLEGAEEPHPKK